MAPMRSCLLAAVLGLLALPGCFTNVTTPFEAPDSGTLFPPGLEPLEPDTATPPAPVGGDMYPEQLSMLDGYAPGSMGHTPSVQAIGYVHAPVAAVWAAVRNPDVGADRRSFTSYSWRTGTEMYDYSLIEHAIIVNVVTVEYEVTWRHGVVVGTLEAPTEVAITYQKTWGSTAIADLRGSFVLTEVAPGITEMRVIEYLRASGAGHANIHSFFSDMFAEVLALAHGLPEPPISAIPPAT